MMVTFKQIYAYLPFPVQGIGMRAIERPNDQLDYDHDPEHDT